MTSSRVSVASSPVLGIPSDTVWSQVLHDFSETGEFFLVFSASGEDARKRGRACIEHIANLFTLPTQEFNVKFKKALAHLSPEECSCATILIQGDSVYAWSYGYGFVRVVRGGKTGKIVESQDHKIVMGKPKIGDIFILGTRKFSEIWVPNMVRGNEDTDALASGVIAHMQNISDNAGIAAYFIEVQMDGENERENAQTFVEEKPVVEGITHGKLEVGSGKLTRRVLGALLRLIKQRRIIIHSASMRKGKLKVYAVGVIAFVCVVLGMFLFVRYTNTVQQKKANALIAPYQQQFVYAQQLYGENKNESRALTQKLLSDVTQKMQEYPEKSFEKNTFDKFSTSVQEYYMTISGEKTSDDLSVFYDFRLMKSDFIGKHMKLDGTKAYVYDPEGKSIIMLDVSSKQATIISVGAITDGKDITVMNGDIYVLAGDGIYSVSSSGETRRVIEKTEDWKQPYLLASFGSNMYMLDSEAKQVYKYAAQTQTSFSAPTSWLKSTQSFDVSATQSFSIDGKVWLSSRDGSIGVFSQGTRESFAIRGLEQATTGSVLLYTDGDSSNVYILETSTQRLIVVDKNKELQQVVRSKQFAGATSLVVLEAQKKAYIGVGSVVYEVSL